MNDYVLRFLLTCLWIGFSACCQYLQRDAEWAYQILKSLNVLDGWRVDSCARLGSRRDMSHDSNNYSCPSSYLPTRWPYWILIDALYLDQSLCSSFLHTQQGLVRIALDGYCIVERSTLKIAGSFTWLCLTKAWYVWPCVPNLSSSSLLEVTLTQFMW